jgi:hypothetical protein
LSGLADTTISLRGPTGDEIRNVALPATTMRVVVVPVPDAATVRRPRVLCNRGAWRIIGEWPLFRRDVVPRVR